MYDYEIKRPLSSKTSVSKKRSTATMTSCERCETLERVHFFPRLTEHFLYV